MQPQVCCERRGPQAGSSLVCGAGAALGVQRLSRRQASPTTALLTRPNRPATKARPSPEAGERERDGAREGTDGLTCACIVLSLDFEKRVGRFAKQGAYAARETLVA